MEGGFLDKEKLKQLTNFTDASCLTFGARHDTFLAKALKVLPWFVNEISDFHPHTTFVYRHLMDMVSNANEAQWSRLSPLIPELDSVYSSHLVRNGCSHYAIKYNPFMAVRSDWFVAE